MRIVHIADDRDGAEWDAYVTARPSSVTDLIAWRRVVSAAYGIRSHFLAAREGQRIAGVLGLFEVDHPVFGHYLTTAIFGNDGGLQFDDAGARQALVDEAKDLARRLGVGYLVIRTRHVALDGFIVDDRYRTAVIDLEGGVDALWNRLPNKTRNQVRRGLKEGFTVDSGHEHLAAFHDVFHRHMRDLGSPAHSRRYYESIVAELGDRCDFLVVRDGRTLVAGALLFRQVGWAMNYHTVALRAFNARCPNYLLYWKLLELSAARGCRWFDMGRSQADSSNLGFKSNWRPAAVTLHYNYHLVKATEISYLDPRNPKYRIAIAAWRRMPLFLTRRLGPRLITGLA